MRQPRHCPLVREGGMRWHVDASVEEKTEFSTIDYGASPDTGSAIYSTESGIIHKWKMQGDSDINNSLHLAVREGRLENVKELISLSDSYVLLRDALEVDHREDAKILLTNGCKVNSINENASMTPLHFAVRNDDIEIVEMLLDRGANIDAESEDCSTPLHDAIRWKKPGVVYSLLKRGANINAVGKYGITALHVAVEEDNTDLVPFLISHHGANVNSECIYGGNERCTPLYIAVIKRHAQVVEQLLEYGANVDAEDQHGKTILYFAIQTGHCAIFGHLLHRLPDVNNIRNRYGRNIALLYIALRKYGDSINSKCIYAQILFNISSEWIAPASVRTCLKYNSDTDPKAGDGTLALDIANPWKNILKATVKCLVESGADINIKNKRGKTALQIASGKDKLEIVEVLLKFGAKVDSRDDDGNTALHIASGKNNLEIVEALLKFGADIDSKEQHGKTALHIASEKGNIQIVNVLLKYVASIDSKDRHGKTALHYASLRKTWVYRDRNIEIAKTIVTALLDHGSDITMVNKKYYHESCTEILKRHAVKVKTANLYVMDRNLLISSDDEELSDFRDECEREVATMKRENIDISFHDILTKGISELVRYARNKNLVQVFGSDDYKIKFPIYATLINRNFRKGERRKVLIDRCNEMVHNRFTNFLHIPYECTEQIFNYLSDEDLRTLMDALKPDSVYSSNTDNKQRGNYPHSTTCKYYVTWKSQIL